jgi:hypothetical protein
MLVGRWAPAWPSGAEWANPRRKGTDLINRRDNSAAGAKESTAPSLRQMQQHLGISPCLPSASPTTSSSSECRVASTYPGAGTRFNSGSVCSIVLKGFKATFPLLGYSFHFIKISANNLLAWIHSEKIKFCIHVITTSPFLVCKVIKMIYCCWAYKIRSLLERKGGGNCHKTINTNLLISCLFLNMTFLEQG